MWLPEMLRWRGPRRGALRATSLLVPRIALGLAPGLVLGLVLGTAPKAGAQETDPAREEPEAGRRGDAGVGWEVRAPWEEPQAAPANPCTGGGRAKGAADADPPPPNPCGARHGRALDPLIDEFMATGEAVRGRPGGDEPVRFPGPPERPNWFQALAVTSDANPLLERECKEAAMALSVDSLRHAEGIEEDGEAMRAAVAHMREHQRFIRENRVSYADYLKSIAECQSFCAPLVASLVRCHVLSVARQPHGIVGFELDSSEVRPEFAEGILSEVVDRLREQPEDKVLLVGRASQIGDLRYNRRLSAQRALAVKDHLVARGVEGGRIETMWLGWEPPQITESVATEYGIDELYRTQGKQRINQSVLVVTYPRAVPEPL